jgi:3-oxoacyl-[acyl-carrier protein] reductase
MNPKEDFSGKKVLITGASKGVGLALTEAFLSSGAVVYGIARDISGCPAHPNGFFAPVDLADAGQIRGYCEKITDIDIIINNAAITYSKKIGDIPLEEWENLMAVNLTAPFLIIKCLREKINPGGCIINVSSIAGRNRSIVAGVHYTASKAGLIGLTRQLAYEFGPSGIRVNCVCPSQTLTPMLKASMSEPEMKKLSDSIPLRRLANVDDIVEPVMFLASERSSYLNGSIIDINGGQL